MPYQPGSRLAAAPGFVMSGAAVAAHADETAERLARIETAIAEHRRLYLAACWAGHDGEAEHHEGEVDRLLQLWQEVRDRRVFAERVVAFDDGAVAP